MLTLGRWARPDAQCPSEVIGKLGIVVGVVDGEYAIFGSLAVEIPLDGFVHKSNVTSLRSSRVAAAKTYRWGEERLQRPRKSGEEGTITARTPSPSIRRFSPLVETDHRRAHTACL